MHRGILFNMSYIENGSKCYAHFTSRENSAPPAPLTEPFSVNTSQDTDLNIANKPTAASCSNNGDGKAM